MQPEKFHSRLKEYLRQGGYSQKQLAYEMGLHPTLLSNKLNRHNSAYLTNPEAKQLIKILTEWGVITSGVQALELLGMLDLTYQSFSQTEWNEPPLALLAFETESNLALESGAINGVSLSQKENLFREGPQNLAGTATGQELSGGITGGSSLLEDNLSLLSIPTRIPRRREDWKGPIETGPIYGRDRELAELKGWILEEGCRVVGVLGMGGIGKTALALKLVQQLKTHFDFVIWHSLYNAPPLASLIKDLLQFLAAPAPVELSGAIEGNLHNLLAYLQKARVLLVLDNWETLLESGRHAGVYRPGYEEYARLLEQIGQLGHHSCLILTSREKPRELEVVEARVNKGAVRSIRLNGLTPEDAGYILGDLGLVANGEDQEAIVKRYSGNPLALKLVVEPLQTLFGGKVEAFLAEEWGVFGEIEEVLAQQFKRLSQLEQQIIYWLALAREPQSLQELNRNLFLIKSGKEIAEALISLARRNILEREQEQPRFGLQPVVLEYLTEQLVAQISAEISAGQFNLLQTHALLIAEAKDYVKNSQRRLILRPVLDRLLAHFISKAAVEAHLEKLVQKLREQPFENQGYSGGNLVNLLVMLKGNLDAYDFSNLRVWQADLQGVELHGVNFAGADLGRSVFTQVFDSVTSLAFSPDGKLVAGGCYSGEVRVWEVSSGQQLFVCKGHQGVVWSVEFSPEGNKLVSGSLDQTVRFWEVASGRCLGTLEGHTNWVWSVAFSPDGKFVASGSLDRTIRLWEVASETCLKTLQGHDGAVWGVAFSPDGKLLVSGSSDQNLKLWEVTSGNCLRTMPGHTDWVVAVAFSPDGKTLASGSNDRTLKLWEVVTGACFKTLQGHTNTVYTVAFSPDGELLASGSLDQTVKIWEAGSGVCLKTLQGHTSWVWTVAFSPDSTVLASGGTDQSIKLWEVNSGECFQTLQGYTNWVYNLAFNPEGNFLASGSTDDTIKLWEVNRGVCLKTLKGHVDTVMSLAFGPDGKLLLSGSLDRTLKLWEVANGTCLKTFEGHSNEIWAVAFSPDGDTVASGSVDHSIKLWKISTGELVQTWSLGNNWIYALAFSPDGKILASGSLDGAVRLWDVQARTHLKTLEGHSSEIRSVAFSPDGKILASGSIDRTIKLWEVASGTCFATLAGHKNWVYAVAFSPDGKLLASGSTDQTLKLWDVTGGACLKTLEGHSKLVRSVTFSPDGKLLASGGNEEAIKLWDVDEGTCLKTLRASRPYEGMNISGVRGINQAQIAGLIVLGANQE